MSVPPPVGCRYRISGAAVAGLSHQSEGRLCEDIWEGAVFGVAGAAVAVADGLGSAPHGRRGAMVAVSAAIEALSVFFIPGPDGEGCDAEHEPNHAMVRGACRAAHNAVFRYASACNISSRSFACTLIVLLWNGNQVTTARIGDGAVVCLQGGEQILLSAPQERRYVNEVVPLTDEGYEDACVISSDLSCVTACAIFTDGCERLFLEKKPDGYHPHEPFFLPFFSAIEPLAGTPEGDRAIANLLVSDKFISFSEDDKTLVVVTTNEGSGEYTG
ncbi:protein phosphatase 2C domain-containing protein [Methanogenium organophilum]|uniref:Protein phosphatase 2C domain-containing protein n=1 Tax=Methanogenium organophilum TaxID=2199 RepID=A0A9X9S578_METOG|nr:protein phosphatase 2C domain-containing protein [Methanogenium organophilum]WAI01678.1 protein phosphatase 2C domain-containing protein [Methanogenium organophilum]